MMTRLEALELSEPLEKVYADATDQCLVNIARHFNTGKNLPSLEWQMRKLAELGQVTRENVRIIAQATGQNEELVMAALQSSFADALKDVDPKLREAAMRGFTEAQPSETVLAYGAANALQQYQSQAAEDLNLVNTVMLNSSLEQYRRVISNTVQYEAQLNKTQEILNETTGEAILGVATRQQAIRKALKQMSDEGLTGFVDKGGHHWSPEAYVAMDVRTTITNTAHAAVDQRMEDYGLDLIEVTAHAGARPLCYPFQGKLFSMSNRSGVTTDLNGEEIPYAPFNTTSYGEPAGLFGINCGHFKYPFIPGFSRQRDWPVQDQEENDRVYAESQQQRALERNIRYAKREAAVMKAAGDEEGFEKAALKVKGATSAYKTFLDDTGRTPRLDRTQVLGYNKRTSEKAFNATIKAKTAADDGGKWDRGAKKLLLPNAISAATTQEKLQGYLLNTNHPQGKDKARVINSVLGYHYENWGVLSDKIFDAAQRAEVTKVQVTQHGNKYITPMRITGEKQKSMVLKVVWQIDFDSDVPRIITVTFDKRTIRTEKND